MSLLFEDDVVLVKLFFLYKVIDSFWFVVLSVIFMLFILLFMIKMFSVFLDCLL